MKSLKNLAVFLFSLVSVSNVSAQTTKQNSTYRRHLIGSSVFVLSNLLPDPPSSYQLNYGYRLTPKDVISIEAITWTYHAPLGIPYGPSKDTPKESYPGSIKGVGLGLAYQRFLWKNFYSAIHATPFLQTYRSEKKEKIQNGFQLFSHFDLATICNYLKIGSFSNPQWHLPIGLSTPICLNRLRKLKVNGQTTSVLRQVFISG